MSFRVSPVWWPILALSSPVLLPRLFIKNRRFKQNVKKALIALAAEENKNATGRTRVFRIPDASAMNLRPFIIQAIELGDTITTVITNCWDGYNRLGAHGYSQWNRVVTVS